MLLQGDSSKDAVLRHSGRLPTNKVVRVIPIITIIIMKNLNSSSDTRAKNNSTGHSNNSRDSNRNSRVMYWGGGRLRMAGKQ